MHLSPMSLEFLHITLNLNQMVKLRIISMLLFFLLFLSGKIICGLLWSLSTTSPTNSPVFHSFCFNSWMVHNVKTVLFQVQAQYPDYGMVGHCPCLCLRDGITRDDTVSVFSYQKIKIIWRGSPPLLLGDVCNMHTSESTRPMPNSPCQAIYFKLESVEQPNLTWRRAVAGTLLLWLNYAFYQLFGFIA